MYCRWLVFFSLMALSIADAFAASPPEISLAGAADALLQRELKEGSPGATVLVAKDDRVLYRAARGSANIELACPLDPQSVFRIGSITKMLTAATVLKLVAADQLSLDDGLSRFFPDYPNANNISIAQLLNHTAGISDAWEAEPEHTFSTEEMVKAIQRQPPDFAPGTAWRYSNSGYLLLGAVIEAVSKKPWHVAMRDLILAPLGMTRSGFYSDAELVPGFVQGYSVNSAGAIVRPPYVSIAGPGAAGALTSTVDDLFHFMRALATGQVLPAKLYEVMTAAKTTSSGQPVGYGYGVMLGTVRGELVIEHNGGIEGFTSQLAYFPKQGVTVVVLANTDAGLPAPRSLAHRLGALAIGQPYPVFREELLTPETLRSLVGAYRLGSASVHTLTLRDNKLFMRRDEGPERQMVTAEGGILYFLGDGTDYLRVIRGEHGEVVALEFHADGMEPARRELRIRQR